MKYLVDRKSGLTSIISYSNLTALSNVSYLSSIISNSFVSLESTRYQGETTQLTASANLPSSQVKFPKRKRTRKLKLSSSGYRNLETLVFSIKRLKVRQINVNIWQDFSRTPILTLNPFILKISKSILLTYIQFSTFISYNVNSENFVAWVEQISKTFPEL